MNAWRCMVEGCPIAGRWQDTTHGTDEASWRTHYYREHRGNR